MDLAIPKLKLPKRYIAFILTAFILILGIGLGVAYYVFKETVRETVHENQNAASFLSKLVLEHQKATLGIIQAYSLRPLLVEAAKRKDVQKALPHLRNLIEKNSEVEQVFITDKEGVLWINYPASREALGKEYSNRNWYRAYAKNGSLMFPMFLSGHQGRETFPLRFARLFSIKKEMS